MQKKTKNTFMNKDYRTLIDRLKHRQNPDGLILEKSFSDELVDSGYKYADVYIKRAMQAVEPEYTQKSMEAGNKVKEYLKSKLSNVDYEFQGSVMTNTHIKGYSDIDLLTICNNSYGYDSWGVSKILSEAAQYPYSYSQTLVNRLNEVQKIPSYQGNPLDDLHALRLNSEYHLNNQYSYVDISKPKSIKVSLTYPKRDVDVVIAGWYNNAKFYLNNEDKIYRGVQIYDKEKKSKIPADYPFLRIYRLNQKDASVNGRLKKMIRFLKTIKCDASVEIDLSSFEINSICYAIETDRYKYKTYIELLPVLWFQLNRIITDEDYRKNLYSIDDKEQVFKDDYKTQQLKLLINELNQIGNDLING